VTVKEYLNAKYSVGGPESDRFKPDAEEVHSSQVSECQRKRWWKHDRGHRADPSPYFELGRVFEVMYGAALAFEYDPATTTNVLKKHSPWEVVERAVRVKQDVGITIELGECRIIGECDWVVFESDLTFDHITLRKDGTRVVYVDGEEYDYEGRHVTKVVETKTKKDLDWVRQKGPDEKHVYQVYPYVHALNCPGEIAYMQRNDWEELVVPIEYDEDIWMDCMIRAKQHHHNMAGDTVPSTSPLDDDECYFCPFKDECKSIGGSAWD